VQKCGNLLPGCLGLPEQKWRAAAQLFHQQPRTRNAISTDAGWCSVRALTTAAATRWRRRRCGSADGAAVVLLVFGGASVCCGGGQAAAVWGLVQRTGAENGGGDAVAPTALRSSC